MSSATITTRPMSRRAAGPADDSALLDQIRHGRSDALAELYARYAAPMWGIAAFTLAPHQAEDVMVAVFADLWHSPSIIGGETARDARLPVVCRLIDAVLRRSLALRPGAIRERDVGVICGFTARERAVLVLITGGATPEQAGAAIKKSPRAVALMLRETLGELRREPVVVAA